MYLTVAIYSIVCALFGVVLDELIRLIIRKKHD